MHWSMSFIQEYQVFSYNMVNTSEECITDFQKSTCPTSFTTQCYSMSGNVLYLVLFSRFALHYNYI